MSNIVPFEEKKALAAALVASEMFGVKNVNQALSLMALCEAEGLHPARAVQIYHIIQGRAAIKADALLARFQEAGGSVQWNVYTDEKVEGTFKHPQGGSITVDWTIERAKKIGLAGKDNWRNYPRNMMRARCISEAVRAVYPGIATGIYTSEEVMDMAPQQVKDMGAIEQIIPEEPPQELLDQANAACEKGLTEYEKFWAELTKEDRKLIGPSRHADFKAKAEEVPA